MASTIAEKILAKASRREYVKSGEIVDANIDLAMSHDNTSLVVKIFNEMKKNSICNPNNIVIVLDHRSPAMNMKAAENHKIIREFIKQHNIQNFYDIHEGICHQILPENGLICPGMLIVGTDSHTTTYGAFGAFATGIGATDMASVWSTGKLWLKVPKTLRFNINGRSLKYVMSKDIILYIIGKIGADGANYKSCEFYGDTIANMSIDGRMCIANQSMEAGAKAVIIPPDKKTINYLKTRVKKNINTIHSDSDVKYEKIFNFDITDIEPQVACPDSVDNIKPVSKISGININQAVLGSCTNGRIEDLSIASKILKGKSISKNVRMLVIPASRSIYIEAIKKGYINTFLKAGAVIINPGCGPCLGLHEGVPADGECVISSTNRNFRGRMGARGADIYLGSPATVAASALKGEIIDPGEVIS
jgi:3-isopropylmalate/(R)-2-methylmalate dehydratase large subunit